MNPIRAPRAIITTALLLLSFLPATPAPAQAADAEYTVWIDTYATRSPVIKFDDKPARLRLIVTAVDGEEPPGVPPPFDSHLCSIGCQVATDGRVAQFMLSNRGGKGSGYSPIPDDDLKRLEALLAKLPDDHSRLPPLNRRVMLQIFEGDRPTTRVYDRAAAPDDVLEILRLSRSAIRAFLPEFKPQAEIAAGDDAHDGFLVASPDGRHIITSGRHGSLKYWDPSTRELVKEVVPPAGIPAAAPSDLLSPPGKRSLRVTQAGDVVLWDTDRRRGVATLDRDARIVKSAFSPDGTKLALTTARANPKRPTRPGCRISLWSLDTGQLLHELRPFEQSVCENVEALLWTADGEYVLAATKSDGSFTSRGIDVFSAATGRHRGEFTGPGGKVTGLLLRDHDRQLIAGCGDGKIRYWNAATALQSVRDFERSLQP